MHHLLLVGVLHKLLLGTALFAATNLWDTSSYFLFDKTPSQLALRLLAWDNVFFNAQAQHGGPIYEAEYAFSQVWSQVIAFISPQKTAEAYALTAAALSLAAHFLAVWFLYKLTLLAPNMHVNAKKSALVYILNPAGIFLINGYCESPFAALVFLGLLLLLQSKTHRKLRYLLAGGAFALATLIRPNGLLWGLMFTVPLLGEAVHFVQLRVMRWDNVFAVILGGSLLLLSFFIVQYAAYVEHCPGFAWCHARIPSVYLYVQSHYWNNGFLKYWTVGNLPNFLLALPTLVLLFQSTRFLFSRGVVGIALVQTAMLIGVVFFWHVQIITRMASCTPGLSWYVASLLEQRRGKYWIWFFIVWTAAQAALFGAFLPPA